MCEGYHEHEVEGVKVYYMPCESHTELKAQLLGNGYEHCNRNFKMKNGKKCS